MAFDDSADLRAMYSTSDFAVKALIRQRYVDVIFDNEFAAADLGESGVEHASPQLTCQSADIPDVVTGDAVTIDDVDYYVRGIQPDGHGVTRLILSKD